MTAIVTALRATQAGIVQRPRRKAHVASWQAQDGAWWAICDRVVQSDRASFYGAESAAELVDELDLCADCYRLVLLASRLAARWQARSGNTQASRAGAAR